ncbi:hypothetical protein ACIQ9E_06870 [Streptomyces sp. NPDC094448]|uniref:hypothetical protein n=1 Tax=Streptomyces sp. NPDC094448 TaxID=3366063 RepID=UPI003811012E
MIRRGQAVRGGRRACAAAVAAVLLTGCGVGATEPVEAGGPAVFALGARPQEWTMLFFRSPTDRPVPVLRVRDPFTSRVPTPVLLAEAVDALLAGPSATERATGLSTALPKVRAGAARETENGMLGVDLPVPVRNLDETAVQQLVCTMAYTRDRNGRARVVVTGTDGAREPAGCELAVDLAPTRPTTSPVPEPPPAPSGAG